MQFKRLKDKHFVIPVIFFLFSHQSRGALLPDIESDPFALGSIYYGQEEIAQSAQKQEFELGNVREWASLLPSPRASYSQRLAKIPKGQKLTLAEKDTRTGRIKVSYTSNGRQYSGWVDANRIVEAGTGQNPNQGSPAVSVPGKEACQTSMRSAQRVTHYFAPVLPRYEQRRCSQMEGTCIIRREGQEDLLYNVGYGTQVRDSARNGCSNGYGNRGNCLFPFKVVAADRRYHRNGDILFFPKLRGLKIGNQYHDGFVQVADVGSAIKGSNRFDFFIGECTRFSGDSCKSVDGNRYERLMTGASFCKAAAGSYQSALLDFDPANSQIQVATSAATRHSSVR